MKEYTRNHFVPKSYLKGFSKNKSHIHRMKTNLNSNYENTYKLNAGLKSVGFKNFLTVINNPILFELLK